MFSCLSSSNKNFAHEIIGKKLEELDYSCALNAELHLIEENVSPDEVEHKSYVWDSNLYISLPNGAQISSVNVVVELPKEGPNGQSDVILSAKRKVVGLSPAMQNVSTKAENCHYWHYYYRVENSNFIEHFS